MANTDGNEWVLIDTNLTTRLAIIPTTDSHLDFKVNEPGSGKLTLPLDSNSAALASSGMFAAGYYRGQYRGGFFIDNIEKTQSSAAEDADKLVTLAGRGALALLEDANVWDDGTSATTRVFTAQTRAAILITLIDEAQARGGLLNLSYDFTAVLDSDGQAWSDSETLQLNVDTSLLDVVRQFARIGIDFDITLSGSTFVLSAYKLGIGTDKSNTIYFRVGRNCEEVKSEERGSGIKNVLRVKYKGGYISVSDAVSIAANRRREGSLNADVAQTSSSASTIGAAELALNKDPKKSITVKIYDGVGPRVFVDYQIGDYIKLDVDGVETRYRILGLRLDWDGKTYSNVVVDLNSIFYENDIQLAQDVGWLLDQWNTANDAGLLEVSYWAALGTASDSDLNIYALHVIGTKLYVGFACGTPKVIGGITASFGMAIYDLQTGVWSVPSTPPYATFGSQFLVVYAFESSGTDLYVAGHYYVDPEEGDTYAPIGIYDTLTDTWTYIGQPQGLGASIFALHLIGTDLYVGGAFTSIGATTLKNIAKYDTVGGTWSAVGATAAGSYTPIYALGSLSSVLYAGTSSPGGIGNQAVDGLGKFSGGVWSEVGGGLDGAVLCITNYGTNLLVGGSFTGYIAEWDTVAFTLLGSDLGGTVRSLAVYLTDIYAGGDFTTVGNRIARLSGGAWWPLGTGLNGAVRAIALYGDDVIAAGGFSTAGDKPSKGIAEYFTNFESLLDYLENSSSNFNMGAAIHGATASAVTDSDEFPFWEDVSNALRKITWANIKATIKTYFDTLYVALTGNQTIAGIKTFTSDPIIPDEAYDATAWNGSLEPPTKNAVRDKIESLGGGGVPYTGATANVDLGAFDLFAEVVVVGNHAAVNGAAGDVEMFAPDGQNPAVIQHAHGGVPGFVGFASGGTEASPTAVIADQVLYNVAVYAYDGIGDYTNAHLKALAGENHSATNHGTKWVLYGTPNGSTVEEIIATFDSDGINIPTGNVYKINGASLDTLFAAIAKGVTNGDSHDHSGGDGAQIAYSSLSGTPTVRELLTSARTYYVRTDGSDSNNGLTDSAGGAFLTIGKAFTVISTIDKNGYAVTVQCGTGTFAEAVAPTTGIGEGNVSLQGTLTAQETVTAATVAAGTGATAGTVTKTGAFAGNTYANYWAYFVTDAAYRIIDSHTDDVLTLVGTAPSSTTQDVIIYSQGTVISSVTLSNDLVNLTNINVTGITRISSFSSSTLTRCKFDGDLLIQTLASALSNFCVLSTAVTGLALEVAYGSSLDSQYSKYNLGHTSAYMEVNTGGIMLLRYGSLIDGTAPAGAKANYGLHVLSGGLLEITNNATLGYCNIRNCDTGIAADTNGLIIGLTNTTFSGNTANLLINDGLNLVARNSAQFDKTSDTALANITGMSLTLTAGLTYGFEATLYTTSNIAGGVKAAIAGTATATSIIYECQTFNTTTLSAATRATALGTAVGAVTAVTVALMKITGTITVNAGGTLTVQFAQNVSNAAASSVLGNSTFKAWAIP